MTVLTSRRFQPSTGEQIEYYCFGNPHGTAIVYSHGMPGCGLESQLLQKTANESNLFIIAANRFGYGNSSQVGSARLERWAQCIDELTSHLNIHEFYIVGVSGGASYALCCASLSRHSVLGTAIICGLAPMTIPDLAKDMPAFTRLAFWLSKHQPQLLELTYGVGLKLSSRYFPSFLLWIIAQVNAGNDKKTLCITDYKTILGRAIRHAFICGWKGALHDIHFINRPWPFLISDLENVHLWYSPADPVIPLSHGQWFAEHIHTAIFHTVEDEGHFSLPINHAQLIIHSLVNNT